MTLASLITFIVVLVILGLVVYLVETYIPLSPPIKVVLRVVVVLVLCLWLLQTFGGYRACADPMTSDEIVQEVRAIHAAIDDAQRRLLDVEKQLGRLVFDTVNLVPPDELKAGSATLRPYGTEDS